MSLSFWSLEESINYDVSGKWLSLSPKNPQEVVGFLPSFEDVLEKPHFLLLILIFKPL